MNPLIIIGTGLAGYNLVKEFRKYDSERKIIMVTTDDGHYYSKPMLSCGLTKDKTADELLLNTRESMAVQLNVEIKIFTEVKSVNTEEKSISLNESTLNYSQLVFALGAEAFKAEMKGDGFDGVHSVNNLLDYSKFRLAIKGKSKIVIIGSGLIGCEFANDLSNSGYQIDIIDPSSRPLKSLLPAAASTAVKSSLETLGVKFHLNVFASAIYKKSHLYEVELSNGLLLEAEVILSAVGLRPRVQLAKATGLAVNEGIQVDSFLQTSARDVYSLGDCAEVEGHSMLYILPLMKCAKALAQTLSGEPTSVKYTPMPITIKTPACPVVISPIKSNEIGEWRVEAIGKSVTARFIDRAGNLAGFALTGDAISQRMTFQKELSNIFS